MEQQSSTPEIGLAQVIISAMGFAVSLSSAQQITSIAAGMVSIVAGFFAIRYYIKKTK